MVFILLSDDSGASVDFYYPDGSYLTVGSSKSVALYPINSKTNYTDFEYKAPNRLQKLRKNQQIKPFTQCASVSQLIACLAESQYGTAAGKG